MGLQRPAPPKHAALYIPVLRCSEIRNCGTRVSMGIVAATHSSKGPVSLCRLSGWTDLATIPGQNKARSGLDRKMDLVKNLKWRIPTKNTKDP